MKLTQSICVLQFEAEPGSWHAAANSRAPSMTATLTVTALPNACQPGRVTTMQSKSFDSDHHRAVAVSVTPWMPRDGTAIGLLFSLARCTYRDPCRMSPCSQRSRSNRSHLSETNDIPHAHGQCSFRIPDR